MFDVIINVHILYCIFHCAVLLLPLQEKDAKSVDHTARAIISFGGPGQTLSSRPGEAHPYVGSGNNPQ